MFVTNEHSARERSFRMTTLRQRWSMIWKYVIDPRTYVRHYLERQRRESESHSGLLRHANLKVTMDTYVQAVSDEKRVKMLLAGIRKREAV